MVVVTHAIFEPRGRAGRLDPANQALGGEQRERVVDRLERDRADLAPHRVGDGVGGDVRRRGDGAQHREPLGGDVNGALAQERSRVGGHAK